MTGDTRAMTNIEFAEHMRTLRGERPRRRVTGADFSAEIERVVRERITMTLCNAHNALRALPGTKRIEVGREVHALFDADALAPRSYKSVPGACVAWSIRGSGSSPLVIDVELLRHAMLASWPLARYVDEFRAIVRSKYLVRMLGVITEREHEAVALAKQFPNLPVTVPSDHTDPDRSSLTIGVGDDRTLFAFALEV